MLFQHPVGLGTGCFEYSVFAYLGIWSKRSVVGGTPMRLRCCFQEVAKSFSLPQNFLV